MANRWYVALDGEQLGPLSDTGLERLIQGGRVDNATMVRNGASGEWLTVELAEELLAARPSRQRPGEAAIQAAQATRLASQAAKKKGPKNGPKKGSLAPPPVRAPSATGKSPPSPSAKPLVPPPLPSARAVSEKAPDAPEASPPASVADGAPASRSPLIWAGLSGGAAVILAVSLLTGWLASGAFTSSTSSTPPNNPSANVSPVLAALQQQAEQLQREVEAAKARQAAPVEQPASDSPPMPDVPAMPAGAPSAPESSSPPSDPQPDGAPPDSAPSASATPPAPVEPAPGAMKASPSAPESKPADLPAARKELAKLIATEMALEKERDERGRYLKQFKAAPQAEYKSDFRAAIDEQMAAAEKEADALDLEHVALRRKELEDRRNARRKAAARLLAEAKSAAAAADVALAFERTSGYLLVASPEELPSAVTLLRELDQADPWVLYARLVDAPLAELQRVIAEGRLPDGWPKPSEEPAVIEGVRNSAVRLAPMVLSMAQTTQLLEEFVKTEAKLDLAKRRKLLFLFEADKLHDSGELDEGNVKRLVGDFGTFKADDLSPLIDSVLARDSRETGEDTARDYVPAVARGDIKRISLRQLYDECRKTAGDAWPADDQPHPLAGRWEGPSQWQIHIDPLQDEIALSRASPKVRIVQRLCKIGPDYLVAYENRAADQRESSNYPFPAGKLLGPHPLLKFGDFFADGGAVDFTYYALAKDGRMLAIRRRTTTSAHVRENMGREFWRTLDKSQEFREWPDEFRRVDAKAQP